MIPAQPQHVRHLFGGLREHCQRGPMAGKGTGNISRRIKSSCIQTGNILELYWNHTEIRPFKHLRTGRPRAPSIPGLSNSLRHKKMARRIAGPFLFLVVGSAS